MVRICLARAVLAGLLVVGAWGLSSTSAAAWVSGKCGIVNYKFFVPDTSSSGTKFPLVLYLHPNGWQGDADGAVNNVDKDTLPSVLSRPDSQAKNPCFIFAPECPRNVPNASIGAWLSYSSNWNLGWDPNLYTINMADSGYYTPQLHDVVRALDSMVARNRRIDTNRIHLAGGSMGGNATIYLICRYPGRFASATAVAFNGDTSRAKYIINTPMWLFWGDNDPTVAWQGAVLMKDAIVNAGGTPNFKEFDNTGHIWNQVWCYDQPAFYQPGLIPWMLGQNKSTTARFRESRARAGAADMARVSFRGRTVTVHTNLSATVTVFHASGSIISRKTVPSAGRFSIDLQDKSPGVVFVRVADASGQETHVVTAQR